MGDVVPNLVSCKICNAEFESDKQLHSHIKIHKLLLIEYYQLHYPRYDLYEKKIIKFKNKEQYFSTDFNSRLNLKNWLETSPKEEVLIYCEKILTKRKNEKGLIYTPSQVELRSIMSPPVFFLNNLFNGYYEFCERLGFKNKYTYPKSQILCRSFFEDHKIYIDTREQKPLPFSVQTEIKTLKFGDYSLSDKEATCNCYVERKSLNDFAGTLSGGFDRFCREIERAGEAKANLIILIEESLDNCLKFNHLSDFYKKNSRVNPEYVFHNVRKIIQKYPFAQFLFVHGRETASKIIEKLFTCECEYQTVDLQLVYDLKLL